MKLIIAIINSDDSSSANHPEQKKLRLQNYQQRWILKKEIQHSLLEQMMIKLNML